MSDETNYIKLTEEQFNAGLDMLKSAVNTGKNPDVPEKYLKEILEMYIINEENLGDLLATGQNQQAQEWLNEKAKTDELSYIFGRATWADGSKEPLSVAALLALIHASTAGIDSATTAGIDADITTVTKLKILLGEMLVVAAKEDFSEDPVAAKTIEGLQIIYNYLQQGEESKEELDKFFKEQTEFMAIPRPVGIEDFLKINAGSSSKVINFKDFGDTKITFKGRLAIDEQKINEMLRLSFASINPYKAKTGLNTLVELPFTDTMEILGRTQTERNRKEFSRQLRKEMLPAIAHQHIDLKASDGSFMHMEIGGGYFAVNVRKDKIYFKLSDPYAAYLNAGALSQYSSKTLRLGSQRNPLPFYLAIKLQDQYFHDGNRSRKDKQGNPQPTNNILAIKTLLNFCEDTIPKYEDVQKTDRGHWFRQIRKPLEDALNQIQNAGLFEWEYCKKGLTEASPQEISTNDYHKWSSLYITFRLIPEEPDQKERLEHKQERIEAAAAKKDIIKTKNRKARKPNKSNAS